MHMNMSNPELQQGFWDGIPQTISMLEGLISRLEETGEEIEEGPTSSDEAIETAGEADAMNRIKRILSRFHKVVRLLQKRHDNRSTIEIEDEYDVQDLLHALLKIDFDDVRPEEWVPSYAGSSSRMDFLLKREQIVIEAKKTRRGLKDKEVGEQLIIDIARYREHQDCRKLICFVYDPEEKIGNPSGLSADLERLSTDELNVVVKIYPE